MPENGTTSPLRTPEEIVEWMIGASSMPAEAMPWARKLALACIAKDRAQRTGGPISQDALAMLRGEGKWS